MSKLKITSLYKLLFVIAIGYTYIVIQNDIYIKKLNPGHHEIVGTIIDVNYSDDKMTCILLASDKLKVTKYKNNTEYHIGDRVKVSGNIQEPSNNSIFHLFNYKNYLLSTGIHFTMSAEKIEKVSSSTGLYRIKSKIYQKIDNLKSKRYIKTFILGDKSELDAGIKQIYQENGISHLLAISGMHISLLASILSFLLKKFKYHHLLISVFLVFYAFLTSFTPSVIRATLFFIFSPKIEIKKLIVIVASLMLIYNPYYVYNVGFLFSFIISFYLISFSEIINRFKSYFIKVLIVSFISFLAGLPIVINNFYCINFSGIFLNIIFVPFVSFIVFPLSLLALIFPFLDNVLVIVTNTLEYFSLFFNQFNLVITMCYMPFYMVIVYYVLITISLYNHKYFFLILVLVIHANIKQFDKNSYVTLLDVGQGDSAILELKNKTLIIDTGGITGSDYSIVTNKTIPYLKSHGIISISYLVLTHGDYDHMGEAINLVNNFKVEKVIFNCGPYNDLEKELIKVLDKKKIKYYSCIKELNIDNNKLYFLQTKEYDNENDNSNVIYTELDGYKFMFMGDASVTTEKEILEKYNLLDVDVLKVGHHGSKTSSSKDFISEINPKYSIISVGKNNRYGHPNNEVLDNLEDSKIYRTDEDGSIMFKIKNNKLKIETCSP